jgi:hypothetical protein
MKIAIVGYASDTRILAPFHDESWEIWGINEVAMHMPGCRFTQHWNMHPASEIAPDHLEFLRAENEAGRYAVGLLGELNFGGSLDYSGGYYTSQVARMIAHAIDCGAADISLFGINCEGAEEYVNQRPCIEYWLGVAIGKGINVGIPEAYPLLKGEYKPAAEGITDAVLRERIRELIMEQESVQAKFNAIGGGVIELRKLQARLKHARG